MAPWYRYIFLITWEGVEQVIEIRERTLQRAVFMAGVTFGMNENENIDINSEFSVKQIKPTA